MVFTDGGRRNSSERRERGTEFTADIRITRDELAEVAEQISQIIPPEGVRLSYNGVVIERPKLLKSFRVKLPTEIDGGEGLRKSVRETTVEVFDGACCDPKGQAMEMGIPIQPLECPWRLNVGQKVPLGFDRDSVTDAFRRALIVAATNEMAPTLTSEDAAQPWAAEALGDSRANATTVQTLVQKRFGERAVVAVPGDPLANAQAAASGYTVVSGGALSGDAWANIRKHQVMPSTSQAFPTPTATDKAKEAQAGGVCLMCGKPM